MQQHTIAREERFTGIALHHGGEVSVRLLPADADSGIVFRRCDIAGSAGVNGSAEVRADCRAVSDTFLATTLGSGEVRVSMVEHLLSSLAAQAIDNIIIELDGEEVPILDGSAAPWLLFLSGCGLQPLPAPRRRIRVIKEVQVDDGNGAHASFAPDDDSRYHITIDFPHEVVNRTGVSYDFVMSPQGYHDNIARARTFCYVKDVETMFRHQRALGGSLQNAVVYGDEGVINESGLRYPDEFVRHKMLDAIGDCYINGHAIIGRYTAHRPGHGLNNCLMRALVEDESAWEWV